MLVRYLARSRIGKLTLLCGDDTCATVRQLVIRTFSVPPIPSVRAFVCVCVWGTLLRRNALKNRGLRARHWHLSQRRLPVTGRENVPVKEGGEGAPHEEFLGPSWQLDSSPLASASVIFSGVAWG